MGRSGTLTLLVRHFFDTEALSPGGEPETNVVQVLGFMAVPRGFFIILCQPMVLLRWELVSVRNFFVSFSMIVMGFVMVFEWDALFPDRRDYQILTPLPLPLRTLSIAKVIALALFLGIFLVDMNFFGVLLWPTVDSRGGLLEALGVHLVVLLAAGLWAALAAAASAEDYHRRAPSRAELDEVFRLENERVIGNDWVVRYENRFFQVKRHGRRYAPAKSKVVVCEWEDGRLEIHYRGQKVE